MSLVTVTVGSYNSSGYITETLESIYKQTYREIELIIKDDASTDNSVEICRDWIKKNSKRFVRAEIIVAEKNSGPAANFNRGIRAAHGDWIKPIGGDDTLLPKCIEDNMDYIKSHPDINVLFSYTRVYIAEFREECFLKLNPGTYPKNIISEEISADLQYKILLKGDKVTFTPSVYINRHAILNAGLPDEDLFPEDYQMTLNLTKCGYKLYFMEKETVNYRKHDGALNNKIQESVIKPNYFRTEKLRKRHVYPNIPLDLALAQRFSWVVNQIFRLSYFNKLNRSNKFFYYFLNVLLNPFKYLIFFKSHYLSKYKNNLFYK